jgi:hypothetical protein
MLIFSSHCKSINLPLDNIKSSIISFYKEKDPIFNKDRSIEDFPDFLINDRKYGPITEGKEGVFAFGLLASGEITHFLLVEKDSFEILNMEDPIDQNMLKLIAFFERNKKYCKEDVLFYLKDLLITYQQNEEYIRSFNGIIK